MRSPLCPNSPQLLDLVSQIQIQPALPICHPLYHPSEISPEITARFQSLPPDLQRDYLNLHLRNYLYDIYYSGELQPLRVEAVAPAPVLKNNTRRGIDADFYAQLHRANQGQGYFDPDWRVVQSHPDGTMAVQKDGLTVQIVPERHLKSGDRLPPVGEVVAIHLPRNRVETGYYIAVGDAGRVAADQPLLELCFNLTPAGAIATLSALTALLNAQGVPFSFKVWMNPDPRYDTGILHLGRHDYQRTHPILEQVYATVRSHLRPETPLFTKPLAPGLGLAEEPEQGSQDFGLHRCQIVADALLVAEERGDRSPQARLAAIDQQFWEEGLDLQRPYLNPGAEDGYISLWCPS